MALLEASNQDCDFWCEFIQLYHDLPVLWSKAHHGKPKHLRDRALNILLRKYRETEPSATVANLRALLKGLRLEYRTELRMALEDELASGGHGASYESSVWYFELLGFLRSEEVESLKMELKGAEESTIAKDQSQLAVCDNFGNFNVPDVDVYCKLLVAEMKKMAPEQVVHAKRHFERILNLGRMGMLSNDWPQASVHIPEDRMLDVKRRFDVKDSVDPSDLKRFKQSHEVVAAYVEQPIGVSLFPSSAPEECLIEEDVLEDSPMETGFQVAESNSRRELYEPNVDHGLSGCVRTEKFEIAILDASATLDGEAHETMRETVKLSHEQSARKQPLGAVGRRQCMMHSSSYIDNVVPDYSDEEFLRQFRIGRDLVQMLCRHLEQAPVYKRLKGHGGYEAISAQTHVLAFLWFLGHDKASYREVADRFSLSVSCLHDVIWRVSDSILTMEQDVIVRPDEEKKTLSASVFSTMCNIPRVIGCVGGMQIKIDKPTEHAARYFLRKGYYSMQLQAIIDEDLRFVDVFVEYPGEPELMVAIKAICGDQYCLLGSSAYACLPQLLVPYRATGVPLTEPQKTFNEQVQTVTGKCLKAFLHLKQRFRQLHQLKGRHLSKVVKLIKVCCILHNLASVNDMAQMRRSDDDYRHEPCASMPMFTNASKTQSELEILLGQDRRDTICANYA